MEEMSLTLGQVAFYAFPVVPVHSMLRSVPHGGTGVLPSSVYVLTAFLCTHVKQLNHVNPPVADSSRSNLMYYSWRVSTLMPCVHSDEVCDPHKDDHSRLLTLWHRLGWRIHVPKSWGLLAEPHPMGACNDAAQASRTHQWLAQGLTLGAARSAGHDVAHRTVAGLIPPILGIATGVDAPALDFPKEGDWVVNHDASRYPDTGFCGGPNHVPVAQNGQVALIVWGLPIPIFWMTHFSVKRMLPPPGD